MAIGHRVTLGAIIRPTWGGRNETCPSCLFQGLAERKYLNEGGLKDEEENVFNGEMYHVSVCRDFLSWDIP
jgi:hypothetical protein